MTKLLYRLYSASDSRSRGQKPQVLRPHIVKSGGAGGLRICFRSNEADALLAMLGAGGLGFSLGLLLDLCQIAAGLYQVRGLFRPTQEAKQF